MKCSLQWLREQDSNRGLQQCALGTDSCQGGEFLLILHVQAGAVTSAACASTVIISASPATPTTTSTATSTPDRVLEKKVALKLCLDTTRRLQLDNLLLINTEGGEGGERERVSEQHIVSSLQTLVPGKKSSSPLS